MQADIKVVGQATDGCETLHLLDTGLVTDLIITDMNRPHINDLELTTALKTRFPEIRVIMLSLRAGCSYENRAKAAGADALVVRKPIRMRY